MIFVKLPTNKSISLFLKSSDKVVAIKKIIEEKESFPCERQCLYFSGKRLQDQETLAANKISKDATLHLTVWATPKTADVRPFGKESRKKDAPLVEFGPRTCDVEIQVLPVNHIISLRIRQGLKATIREVKDLLHTQEGIECEDLYLDDDVTSEKLEDTVTLRACCVPEKTLVWVQSAGISFGDGSIRLSSLTRRASRALVDAGFEEAFRRTRTLPRAEDMEPSEIRTLDTRAAPEQKSKQGDVLDIESTIAAMLRTHKDCERKLSRMIDEKNRLQQDLLELQNKYPRLLSEVLLERNQLEKDLKQLQREFPRQLALVLDEKQKLQEHYNELQNEFLQMSLVLDENTKLHTETINLQDQLHTLKVELGQEREKSLCNICFDNPRDTLVFSCLHLHFCSSCLQKHQERTNTCPTCRGFISGKLVCSVSVS